MFDAIWGRRALTGGSTGLLRPVCKLSTSIIVSIRLHNRYEFRTALLIWQILQHAFTSVAGKELGYKPQDQSGFMTTQRCAFLMACAIYHELDEVRS